MARVLVVEDSPATRSYIRSTLEDAKPDFEVVEAASGFDALRLLPRGSYDLVITDINMPDINGLELIKFVRDSERHRQVPLLIVSTQSSERDRERGLSLGADGYLAKPFTREELLAAVADSVARRSALAAAPAGEGG